jgi:excisionase family DNA binding protein
MNEELMTTREVASWLRLRVQSIYRLIEQQGMPAYRPGIQWLFKRDEVEAWMRDRAEATRPQPMAHVSAAMLPGPKPVQARAGRQPPAISTNQAIAKLKEIMR